MVEKFDKYLVLFR